MKNPMVALDEAGKRLFKIAPFINVLAPAMVVAAVCMSIFAILEVQKVLALGGQEAAVVLQKSAQPKLVVVPLEAGGYQAAAAVLSRLNPSVKVVYIKDREALEASVTDVSQLPEWNYMMSTVLAYQKGLVWNATDICFKKCENGYAAVADLKAFTQKISVE